MRPDALALTDRWTKGLISRVARTALAADISVTIEAAVEAERERLRVATQQIVAVVGSPGPCSLEDVLPVLIERCERQDAVLRAARELIAADAKLRATQMAHTSLSNSIPSAVRDARMEYNAAFDALDYHLAALTARDALANEGDR
jgi:hypothetical protein